MYMHRRFFSQCISSLRHQRVCTLTSGGKFILIYDLIFSAGKHAQPKKSRELSPSLGWKLWNRAANPFRLPKPRRSNNPKNRKSKDPKNQKTKNPKNQKTKLWIWGCPPAWGPGSQQPKLCFFGFLDLCLFGFLDYWIFGLLVFWKLSF